MNIKKVAEKAGVSITTVSRVLNNPDIVSKKTKEHVTKVMKELNYTPNWFARNLQSNRTGVIGMIVSDTFDPSSMDIARGVEKVASQKQYHMILCNTEFSKKNEEHYIETLINRKIDGLILLSSMLDDKGFDDLEKKGVPFVLIGKADTCGEQNIVFTDYADATEEAISYLIDMGRKRIAIILNEHPKIDNEEKLKGYIAALDKHRFDFKEEMIVYTPSTLEGGYIATSKLLEYNNRPDAIFFATDNLALGGLENLRQMGITPESIGIIGYNDLQVGAIVEPKLTTITKPSYRMGLTGARLLFDLIEDDTQSLQKEPQAVILQSRLKIRKSCGNKERLKEIW